MKKIIVILCLFMMPLLVSAKTYDIDDLSVEVDKSWEVFTRDNVLGNAVLKSRGIDTDQALKVMEDSSMYADMRLVDGIKILQGFVFIKGDGDTMMNLHKYNDKDILTIGKGVYSSFDPNKLTIKEINGYKFVNTEYMVTSNGSNYAIVDYYTVINGRAYTYKFQAINTLDGFRDEIDKIVGSTKFKIDERYEKNPYTKRNIIRAIVAILLIVMIILGLIRTRKQQKRNTQIYYGMPNMVNNNNNMM